MRTHRHRPESRKVSLERVKPEAGEVHVVRGGGRVEAGQDVAHGLAVLGVQAPRVAALHEPPECPALEAAYHGGP